MTPMRLSRLPANARNCQWIAAIFMLLALHGSNVGADEVPVRRHTDSADADLITELLATGMIDTAIKICERYTVNSQIDGEGKVKWLIQWSRAKVAAMLRDQPDREQVYLAEITDTIDAFLANDPENTRVLWLKFQAGLVELAAAKRAVLIAVGKSPDDPDRDEALKRIVRIASALRELSKSIEEEIAIERSKSKDSRRVQDLVSLAIVVATKRIDAVMIRGDLFAEGSDDYVAAANESLSASRALLNSMRPGAEGRADLVCQLAESQRRTGDLEQAFVTIAPLMETDPSDDGARALSSRIAMDRGDLAGADELLRITDARDVKSGIESDLMRLQLAIVRARNNKSGSKQSQREIGDWIQRIGERHGDYARRRAERMVLGTSVATEQVELDPRIIMAQAASRVREGHPDQAAQFLASAARTARDPDDAIQLSIAGAAAYREAKDTKGAAALLREMSLAHFERKSASKMHLQAAILLANTSSPESLIEHLQECRVTWPLDESASTATDWIVRLYVAREDWLSAARTASSGNVAWMTPERVTAAVDFWIKAISLVPISERDVLAAEAIDTLEGGGLAELSESGTTKLATLFRDRSALASMTPQRLDSLWMRWLFGIRQGGAVAEMPPIIDADRQLTAAAVDRLIADGEASRGDRVSIAKAILMLVGSELSLQAAQGYGWAQDWKRAESILEDLQAQRPDDLELAKNSAGLLSRADDVNAKRAGVRLWTLIASRLQQGSADWHEAKLSAIDGLRSLGDIDEAKKLAKYVLLTQPPADPAVTARYRAILD